MEDVEYQSRVSLGQAEKQASEFLTHNPPNFSKQDHYKALFIEYKELVKLFHSTNQELSKALLSSNGGGKSTQEGCINPNHPLKSPPISPKQKECPKCKKAIPKTWNYHQECGWGDKK